MHEWLSHLKEQIVVEESAEFEAPTQRSLLCKTTLMTMSGGKTLRPAQVLKWARKFVLFGPLICVEVPSSRHFTNNFVIPNKRATSLHANTTRAYHCGN